VGNVDQSERVERLFANLRRALPEMERLRLEATKHSSRELGGLQTITAQIVRMLEALAPDLPVHHRMVSVGAMAHGTGEVRSMSDAGWIDAARSTVDAFLEAMYFLESGIHCAREAEETARAAASAELAALLRFYGA